MDWIELVREKVKVFREATGLDDSDRAQIATDDEEEGI